MLYSIYTYKEGTALSKESKLAKKEAKIAKKQAKEAKQQAKSYDKLVKKINKDNLKAEKKANKKNKPFVPVAIPTMEEAFATTYTGKKWAKIVRLIILLALIAYVIFFLYMWFQYTAPAFVSEETTTQAAEPAVYDRYDNQHEITTTPDYDVSYAQALLKQVLHDQYRDLGFSSDPSNGTISYSGAVENINNADCYILSAGGKTFAVSVKLQSVYVLENGEYAPLTFDNTDVLPFAKSEN